MRDLPTAFHSLENERYFAGERIRALKRGQCFVSSRCRRRSASGIHTGGTGCGHSHNYHVRSINLNAARLTGASRDNHAGRSPSGKSADTDRNRAGGRHRGRGGGGTVSARGATGGVGTRQRQRTAPGATRNRYRIAAQRRTRADQPRVAGAPANK
jgi:hypothetical protein